MNLKWMEKEKERATQVALGVFWKGYKPRRWYLVRKKLIKG